MCVSITLLEKKLFDEPEKIIGSLDEHVKR